MAKKCKSSYRRVLVIKTTRLKRAGNSPVHDESKPIIMEDENRWVGEPVPVELARQRWPHRYQEIPEKGITQAKCHYAQVMVDGKMFSLNDDAMVMAEEKEDYICKIIELFESIDGTQCFTAQWYYRATGMSVRHYANLVKENCVCFSEIKDDNLVDCLLDKVHITSSPIEADVKENITSKQHFYCDKMYFIPYCSFGTLKSGEAQFEQAEDFPYLIEEWEKLFNSGLSIEATEHKNIDV